MCLMLVWTHPNHLCRCQSLTHFLSLSVLCHFLSSLPSHPSYYLPRPDWFQLLCCWASLPCVFKSEWFPLCVLNLPSGLCLPSRPASSRFQVNNHELLHSFFIQSLQFSECANCGLTGSTFFCQFIRHTTLLELVRLMHHSLSPDLWFIDSCKPNASCSRVCVGQYDLFHTCFVNVMVLSALWLNV